jgi:uncharacterized membrane protein YphA (DoxX/SURF4 family)
LSITNLLWAVSLLFDPSQYVGKPVIPILFAAIHIAAGLAIITRYRVFGGSIMVTVLTYYWLFVKPREPIAEPQSVGILVISLILVLPHIRRLVTASIPEAIPFLLVRLGLAYPFFEWGLDAIRNPHHFLVYLKSNPITLPLTQAWDPRILILALGLFEVSLAVLLTLGLLVRIDSMVALGALVVFSLVAGYPLALPQDIALAAAAIFLLLERLGKHDTISVDYALDNRFS